MKDILIKLALDEKKFPRMMMLGSEKRMILGKFGKRYIYIVGVYKDQLEKGTYYLVDSTWIIPTEIPEELPPVELTIDEIAKKFKLDPSQVKIKK